MPKTKSSTIFCWNGAGVKAVSLHTLILFCLLVIHFQWAAADGDQPWCYDDEKCSPMHWGGVCKTGHSQSPIDFKPDRTTKASRLRNLKITHQYREIQPSFYIKNNGHTIQVQLREDMTSPLKIASDGLRGLYQFSQLHFHWGSQDHIGSEHTVSGFSYAMELHLVHFSDKYENILAAISDQNPKALAVLGIFFSVSKYDNPALTPIVDAIQRVVNYYPDPLLIEKGLNFSAFFPDILDVFRYEGSLTTPSCAEKVIWTVFRQPLHISQRQLSVFRNVRDQMGKPLVDNARPTQPLLHRRVLESVVSLSEIQSDNEVDTGEAGRPNSDSKHVHGHENETHEHGDDENDIDDLSSHEKEEEPKKNGASPSTIGGGFMHLFTTCTTVAMSFVTYLSIRNHLKSY